MVFQILNIQWIVTTETYKITIITDELLSVINCYQYELPCFATLQYSEHGAQIIPCCEVALHRICRQYAYHIIAAYVESSNAIFRGEFQLTTHVQDITFKRFFSKYVFLQSPFQMFVSSNGKKSIISLNRLFHFIKIIN